MSKKKESDLKKHFESILGYKLQFPDEVALRERISSYTEQEGKATSRDIGTTGKSTKGCSDRRILEVSGIARTGADGTVELMLSNFTCGSRGYEWPAVVVATARAASPIILTAQASLTSNRTDVKIKVATWDASGSPISTTFNWMCQVPTTIIID